MFRKACLLLAALSAAPSAAFTVGLFPSSAVRTPTSMAVRRGVHVDTGPQDLLQQAFIGLAVASTLVLGEPQTATAQTYDQPAWSSTVVMGAAMKTMDMDLPSSYSDISDAKASSKTLVIVEETPKAPPAARSKKKESSNSSSSGSPMGALLPSMNKSVSKESKPKATRSKPAAEKEEKQPKIETVDMSMPSYGENAAVKSKGTFSL